MSDTLASLSRKIGGATDLESVVRSMKALAASSIGQYEQSLQALDGYYRTLELGLVACLRGRVDGFGGTSRIDLDKDPINVIVFGSDQGLVGQFNDVLAEFTIKELNRLSVLLIHLECPVTASAGSKDRRSQGYWHYDALRPYRRH